MQAEESDSCLLLIVLCHLRGDAIESTLFDLGREPFRSYLFALTREINSRDNVFESILGKVTSKLDCLANGVFDDVESKIGIFHSNTHGWFNAEDITEVATFAYQESIVTTQIHNVTHLLCRKGLT